MPAETSTRRRRRGSTDVPRAGGAAPAAAAAAAAAATAEGAAADGTPAQRARPNPRDAIRQLLMRSLLMYGLYHYYWKKPTHGGRGKGAAGPPGAPPVPSAAPASSLAGLVGYGTAGDPDYYAVALKPAWRTGRLLEYNVFTGLQPEMGFREARALGERAAVFGARGVRYDTGKANSAARNVTLSVPPDVRLRNGTWYAHVFVVAGGLWDVPIENLTDKQIERGVLYSRHEIITWNKVDSRKEGKSLLGTSAEDDAGKAVKSVSSDSSDSAGAEMDLNHTGETEAAGTEEGRDTVRYDQVWKPTMPIVIVVGKGPVYLNQLPPPAAAAYRVDEEAREYYAPMHVNEFWMLRDSLRLMNDSVREVTVEMSFAPIGLYKWAMYKQFDNVWDKQISFGTMAPEEADKLKRMFIETNPILLGTTMVVSMAHTVLETLAFKNDISHWKNIKSMEGVSVRSMVWKIVMEAIIFLYLWDNDTSWMITIGNGVGVALAIWKLGKAVKFENFGKSKLFGVVPWFDMVDRESYSKETKEYDDQAMNYMGYALYPLVTMYALYSLMYEKHKSWYSWAVSSLVGAVYAFGFIMMFPQIFINYKLKSVAHMPMKAMMYKTLNTVIDDLFSFIIKMPWLHRVACFRDDVVFLILLYQRWIYPVDKKRVNEFGQQFDAESEEEIPAVVSVEADSVDKGDAAAAVTSTQAPTVEQVKDAEEKKND